ncbi:GNAT family N-acetyltransferase [Globicatella sulfidifaciens]
MITIKRIEKNSADIRLSNHPFQVFGKFIPTYDGFQWHYRKEIWPKSEWRQMTFPDEHYQYEVMKENHYFVGAYNDQDECVALVVYQDDGFKYLYLADIKVVPNYRKKGIASMLIAEGKKIAIEQHYQGLYTIAQDNNLAACEFYLANHFELGGLNTHVYDFTPQHGKHDIYFYLYLPN